MNPYIIIYNRAHERHEAYSINARLICQGSYREVDLARDLADYQQVYLNSRLGRSIFDKLPLHVQIQQITQL